jgi:hypothetical protein
MKGVGKTTLAASILPLLFSVKTIEEAFLQDAKGENLEKKKKFLSILKYTHENGFVLGIFFLN